MTPISKCIVILAAALCAVLNASPITAQETKESFEDVIAAARVNFGRVLQDPLANMRGIINENRVYFGLGPDNDPGSVSQVQGLYALPMPEIGLNVVPRAILPIVVAPEKADFPTLGDQRAEDGGPKAGLSDLIVQSFIGPSDTGAIKWGVGPQFSFATHTDDFLKGPGWGGGVSGVAVATLGQWGLTALGGHLWGFDGDFSTTLVRPWISYNVKSLPGFSVATSPIITYDWKADSGDKWSVPLGGGVTQAIPFTKTRALLVGLGAYGYVARPEFGPDWQINVTFALLFAPEGKK